MCIYIYIHKCIYMYVYTYVYVPKCTYTDCIHTFTRQKYLFTHRMDICVDMCINTNPYYTQSPAVKRQARTPSWSIYKYILHTVYIYNIVYIYKLYMYTNIYYTQSPAVKRQARTPS